MTLADLSPNGINAQIAYRGYSVIRLGWGMGMSNNDGSVKSPEYIDLLIQGPPHPDNKLDRSGLSSLRAYNMTEFERLIEGLGTSV